MGLGSGIYGSTDGITFTRSLAGGADAAQCQAIVEVVTPGTLAAGTLTRHYAFFSSVTEATTGTARYQKSTDNGATWANGESDKVLHDAIFWDKKIIAAWGRGIIFGVVDSVTGNAAWNIDDVNDGEYIFTVPSGYIHFVGVAEAPWGEPAVYFVAGPGSLYVLDFYARAAYPIDIGLGGSALPSMYNGQVVTTDGWNVWLVGAGGSTVRNIGFPRLNGVPPSMSVTGGESVISKLFALDDRLYAVVSKPSNVTALYVYNGVGWSQLGDDIAAFYSNFGFMAEFPPVGALVQRRIYLGGAATTTSTTVKMFYFDQPRLSAIPLVGEDSFAAGGQALITGWIDGGFNDIDGTLLRMNIDAWNLSASNTVRIEYQLDNDESGSWIQMVDSNNAVDVFDNTTNALYFSQATPKRGIKFRTVRFRITLLRGASTQSPEVRAFTLAFLKTPEFRSAWTFQIDANRMIETSATGNDTTYYIDGSPATMAGIWSKLQSLWINSHTLVSLVIPNIEPSPGINVKITDCPMTFDDFRNAVDGLGYIEIQVLEPVPR